MGAEQSQRDSLLAGFVFNGQNQMACHYGGRNLPGFFSSHVKTTSSENLLLISLVYTWEYCGITFPEVLLNDFIKLSKNAQHNLSNRHWYCYHHA
jgi:hypothetical protein